MDDVLRMARVRLNGSSVMRIGGRPALAREFLDEGYLVHCALKELFGDAAPAPFAIQGSKGSWIEVLGYTATDAAEMRALAEQRMQAVPQMRPMLNRETLETKKMPDKFSVGSRYAFRVRACPVVRRARGSQRQAAGSEVDAFLVAVERAGWDTPVDRQEVYRKWIQETIGRTGAAECANVRITAMQLARMVRRAADRKAVAVGRPDVTFEGTLTVKATMAFRDLVRRGIGRHRSFGFGMLLLRPIG